MDFVRDKLEQLVMGYSLFEKKAQPGHSGRVRDYVLDLYINLPIQGIFVGKETITVLSYAAMLHDIGKEYIGAKDVLFSPEPLTPEQRESMETHPVLSAEKVLNAGSSNLYTDIAKVIIAHHENPDGSGYPYGLAGDEISVEARLIRLCDRFDAMTVDRGYNHIKKPFEALDSLRADATDKMDLDLIDVMYKLLKDESSFTFWSYKKGQKEINALKAKGLLPLQRRFN